MCWSAFTPDDYIAAITACHGRCQKRPTEAIKTFLFFRKIQSPAWSFLLDYFALTSLRVDVSYGVKKKKKAFYEVRGRRRVFTENMDVPGIFNIWHKHTGIILREWNNESQNVL